MWGRINHTKAVSMGILVSLITQIAMGMGINWAVKKAPTALGKIPEAVDAVKNEHQSYKDNPDQYVENVKTNAQQKLDAGVERAKQAHEDVKGRVGNVRDAYEQDGAKGAAQNVGKGFKELFSFLTSKKVPAPQTTTQDTSVPTTNTIATPAPSTATPANPLQTVVRDGHTYVLADPNSDMARSFIEATSQNGGKPSIIPVRGASPHLEIDVSKLDLSQVEAIGAQYGRMAQVNANLAKLGLPTEVIGGKTYAIVPAGHEAGKILTEAHGMGKFDIKLNQSTGTVAIEVTGVGQDVLNNAARTLPTPAPAAAPAPVQTATVTPQTGTTTATAAPVTGQANTTTSVNNSAQTTQTSGVTSAPQPGAAASTATAVPAGPTRFDRINQQLDNHWSTRTLNNQSLANGVGAVSGWAMRKAGIANTIKFAWKGFNEENPELKSAYYGAAFDSGKSVAMITGLRKLVSSAVPWLAKGVQGVNFLGHSIPGVAAVAGGVSMAMEVGFAAWDVVQGRAGIGRVGNALAAGAIDTVGGLFGPLGMVGRQLFVEASKTWSSPENVAWDSAPVAAFKAVKSVVSDDPYAPAAQSVNAHMSKEARQALSTVTSQHVPGVTNTVYNQVGKSVWGGLSGVVESVGTRFMPSTPVQVQMAPVRTM